MICETNLKTMNPLPYIKRYNVPPKKPTRPITTINRPFLSVIKQKQSILTNHPTHANMSHEYIPEGYSVLTPYICCRNASRAIDFYRRALGAREEGRRWLDPTGNIGHAELSFGGQKFFVSDPYPDIGAVPPDGSHRAPSKLCLYVPNLDGCIEDCVRYGATIIQPIKEERGLGTRSARIADPAGHIWIISTKLLQQSGKDIRSAQKAYSRGDRF